MVEKVGISEKDFTKMEISMLITALEGLSASMKRANVKETNDAIKGYRNGDIAQVNVLINRLMTLEIRD